MSTHKIIIENIALPTKPVRYTRSARTELPFKHLGVGQSFIVPESMFGVKAVRAAAQGAQRENNAAYSVRAVEGGCRVFRIEKKD